MNSLVNISNKRTHSNEPFIKDFAFYKTRFMSKHKEIKTRLRDFGVIVERFESQRDKAYGDMESGGALGNIQDVIAEVNKQSEEIQMEIDELEEVEKEISKLSSLTQSEKSIQLKLRNALKDLQIEHSSLKKILRAQIKQHQSNIHSKKGDSKQGTSNRLKGLLKEGDKLDKTIAMTQEIIQMGNMSSQGIHAQQEKLKKTGRNIKKIQNSAVPGLDKMIGLIKRVQLRNTLVIAFVVALCLVFMIYFNGYSQVIAASNQASAGESITLDSGNPNININNDSSSSSRTSPLSDSINEGQ